MSLCEDPVDFSTGIRVEIFFFPTNMMTIVIMFVKSYSSVVRQSAPFKRECVVTREKKEERIEEFGELEIFLNCNNDCLPFRQLTKRAGAISRLFFYRLPYPTFA